MDGPLVLVPTNVYSPVNVQERGSYIYFITFTNNYSRFIYIYFMHHTYKVFDKFKDYKAETETENQLDIQLKNFQYTQQSQPI